MKGISADWMGGTRPPGALAVRETRPEVAFHRIAAIGTAGSGVSAGILGGFSEGGKVERVAPRALPRMEGWFFHPHRNARRSDAFHPMSNWDDPPRLGTTFSGMHRMRRCCPFSVLSSFECNTQGLWPSMQHRFHRICIAFKARDRAYSRGGLISRVVAPFVSLRIRIASFSTSFSSAGLSIW